VGASALASFSMPQAQRHTTRLLVARHPRVAVSASARRSAAPKMKMKNGEPK